TVLPSNAAISAFWDLRERIRELAVLRLQSQRYWKEQARREARTGTRHAGRRDPEEDGTEGGGYPRSLNGFRFPAPRSHLVRRQTPSVAGRGSLDQDRRFSPALRPRTADKDLKASKENDLAARSLRCYHRLDEPDDKAP